MGEYVENTGAYTAELGQVTWGPFVHRKSPPMYEHLPTTRARAVRLGELASASQTAAAWIAAVATDGPTGPAESTWLQQRTPQAQADLHLAFTALHQLC